MKCWNLFALLCITSLSTFAQDKLKATSINIFKNGTYFVVKEGDVNIKNNKWSFAAPTNPLLGSIWFTTTKDVTLKRIDYSNDTIKTTREARNWFDIAKTAKGKHVRIVYVQTPQQTKEVKGTMIDVFPESNTLKIKADEGGLLFVFNSSILELQVEGTTDNTFKADSIGRVASLFFSKDNGSTPLKLTYMSTGMIWQPSYNIKIIDDNTLQLEMKALIENFSENIDNADLTLTVGAPQFKYGMQIDPAVLQGYSGIMSPVNNYNQNQYQYQNYAPSAPQAYRADEADAVAVDYNNYQQYTTAGEKSDDVYRYRIGKMTLEKNTKSTFNVFSANLPYDDIYECNVYDYINFYSSRYINNNPETRFDVFHSLKLTNTSNFPFTTAPVFVLDEKLEPLAQDIVNYTPTGGKTKVQLSKAPDVYVTNTEEEKDKQAAAKTINKVVYSLITIKGSIPVENLQPKAITLNLNKYINGTITDASDDGVIKKPGKYAGMNAQTNVEWTVKLGANEKKTITYTYQVYVANY